MRIVQAGVIGLDHAAELNFHIKENNMTSHDARDRWRPVQAEVKVELRAVV